MNDNLQNMSMVDLFRMEAESQLAALTEGLLSLERGDTAQLEAMMRAAHSLKGAGRIVGIDAAVSVAHAMEDCFVAAQRGQVILGSAQVDQLLQGVDILTRIAQSSDAELPSWEAGRMPDVADFVRGLKTVLAPPPAAPAAPAMITAPAPVGPVDDFGNEIKPPAPPTAAAAVSPVLPGIIAAPAPVRPVEAAPKPPAEAPRSDRADRAEARALRVTAENLNRLLGLAGESLVESRWLRPFGVSVSRLKRLHYELNRSISCAIASMRASPRRG